jgi:hypothetical protein
MKKSTTIAILITAILMVVNVPCNAQCVQCSGSNTTGETASTIGINNIASGKASFAGGINSEAIEKYALASAIRQKPGAGTALLWGNMFPLSEHIHLVWVKMWERTQHPPWQ